MSNKIGLKKYPASFAPEARAADDDHVRDDEALFAIGVMDEGELQEKYDDLVRAAEQCMRQRNALWLMAPADAREGIVAAADVERSCAAVGPLFVAPEPTPREKLRASLEAAMPAEVRAAISTRDVFDPAPSKPAASWLTTTCKQGEACRGCAEPDCAAPWYVREPDPWALPSPWAWGRDSTRDWYAYASTAVDVVGVYWDGDDGSTLALDSACEVVGAPDEVHELVRRRNLAAAPAPLGLEPLAAIVDATSFEVEGPVRYALQRLAVRLRGAR